MIDNKNARWFLLAALVLIIFGLNQGYLPKDAVADLEGATCVKDVDCPCWGKYNTTQFSSSGLTEEQATAWGVGLGSCKDSVCDMNLCVDVEPVNEWLQDRPLGWVKDNVVLMAGLLLGGIVLLFWPKR